MTHSRYVIQGLALAVMASLGSLAVAESGTLYWSIQSPSEPAVFLRADLEGEEVQVLPGEGIYFTLDLPNGKRYWHDIGLPAFMRSNLDGSRVEELYSESAAAADLDLDLSSGKVYVALIADEGCGFIFRQDLAGSNQEVLVSDERARGISLDLPTGKLYWADQCTAAVKRSNLDGTGVEVLVVLDGTPTDLRLDLGAGKIYWSRGGAGGAAIERSNLDGTGVETLVSTQEVQSIALDLQASKLYWSEPVFDAVIRRSDLNGGNIEVVISDVQAWRLEIDSLGAGFSAGEVPPSLLVGKVGVTDIQLDWPISCEISDDDYAVYEGTLGGVFETHVSRFCSTGGATEATFTPIAENSYYLVVPTFRTAVEGSYGQNSLGRRSPSDVPCLSQNSRECPECEIDDDCLPPDTCQNGACSAPCNCCSGGNGFGCDNPECEDTVCANDPFCCDGVWDTVCDAEAASLCVCC